MQIAYKSRGLKSFDGDEASFCQAHGKGVS